MSSSRPPSSPARGRTLPVLLAALVLIGGANVAAYAANGHPLLLGTSNTATHPTTLKNTGSGAALSLKARPGSPPLAVTTTKKVNKLNADLVDGLSGKQMENAAYEYVLPTGGPAASSLQVSLPGLPAGTYLATYSVITTTSSPPACYLTRSTSPGGAFEYGTTGGTYSTNTASAVVDQDLATPVTLVCFGSTFSVYAGGDVDSRIVLTPISRLVSAPATAARHAPPGVRHQGPATRR